MLGKNGDPVWFARIERQTKRWTHYEARSLEGRRVLLSNEGFKVCKRNSDWPKIENWGLRGNFFEAPAVLEPEHHVLVVELG